MIIKKKFALNNLVLRDSQFSELEEFVRMEQCADAKNFIVPNTLMKHRAQFYSPDIFYKSICSRSGKLLGFIILVLDPDGESVEFRRIVVEEKGKGVGKTALQLVDRVCSQAFQRYRIWLDVFDFNYRAEYVYKVCGYVFVKEIDFEGKF